MKKGQLPDPTEFEEEDGSISDGLEDELESLRERKGFIEIDKELLESNFITDVRNDTKLLKGIYATWFNDPEISKLDPKLDELAKRLRGFMEENKNRKVILFSAYKDTVDYLYEELFNRGFKRIAKYTAAEGNDSYKETIKANFDASYPKDKQVNDFDILLATDALSEGFNLHRAGIVINYDIPYNPTRVIQRVGRINRINKKVFDNLYVYNCFPTVIGEEEVRIRSISTLKIKLINAVVGSDTKTLTDDEQLVSFFKDEFNKAQKENEQLSWDTKHREAYEQALKNKDVVEKSINIPRRSRVKRTGQEKDAVLFFGKNGSNGIFA
jgi:superfamily II DNA/RNA helicase